MVEGRKVAGSAQTRQKGIILHYPELENSMLVAVTEIRTKEEIDQFVKEVGALQ